MFYSSEPPCGKCPKKGCGTYHSECKEYNEWKKTGKRIVQPWKHDNGMYVYRNIIKNLKSKRDNK